MYKIIGSDGREYGPVSVEELRRWRDEGRVNNDTRVLAANETDWKRLGELPALAGTPPLTFNAPPGFRPGAHVPSNVNGFAIAGLVLGIISLPLCFCCLGLPFNVLGLIFSAIALSQIKQQPQIYSGKGLALSGLICAIISLVLGLIIFIFSLTMHGIRLSQSAGEL